jgi:hypothetical protein
MVMHCEIVINIINIFFVLEQILKFYFLIGSKLWARSIGYYYFNSI